MLNETFGNDAGCRTILCCRQLPHTRQGASHPWPRMLNVINQTIMTTRSTSHISTKPLWCCPRRGALLTQPGWEPAHGRSQQGLADDPWSPRADSSSAGESCSQVWTEQFAFKRPRFPQNLRLRETDWIEHLGFSPAVPAWRCGAPVGHPAGGFGLRYLSARARWCLL